MESIISEIECKLKINKNQWLLKRSNNVTNFEKNATYSIFNWQRELNKHFSNKKNHLNTRNTPTRGQF